MDAVLEVDLELRPVRPFQHLIDAGRAIALRRFGIDGQVHRDRDRGVTQPEMAGLAFLVIGEAEADIRQPVEGQFAIRFGIGDFLEILGLFCDHSGAMSHWPSWPLRRHLELFVVILTHLTCPPFHYLSLIQPKYLLLFLLHYLLLYQLQFLPPYHQVQVPWLKAVTVQSAYIHRNS